MGVSPFGWRPGWLSSAYTRANRSVSVSKFETISAVSVGLVLLIAAWPCIRVPAQSPQPTNAQLRARRGA